MKRGVFMAKVKRERDRSDVLEDAIKAMLLPGETLKVTRNRTRYQACLIVRGDR